MDGRQQIANVKASSRSLKMATNMILYKYMKLLKVPLIENKRASALDRVICMADTAQPEDTQMFETHLLTFQMSSQLLHRSTETRLYHFGQLRDTSNSWRSIRRRWSGNAQCRRRHSWYTGECHLWTARLLGLQDRLELVQLSWWVRERFRDVHPLWNVPRCTEYTKHSNCYPHTSTPSATASRLQCSDNVN